MYVVDRMAIRGEEESIWSIQKQKFGELKMKNPVDTLAAIDMHAQHPNESCWLKVLKKPSISL